MAETMQSVYEAAGADELREAMSLDAAARAYLEDDRAPLHRLMAETVAGPRAAPSASHEPSAGKSNVAPTMRSVSSSTAPARARTNRATASERLPSFELDPSTTTIPVALGLTSASAGSPGAAVHPPSTSTPRAHRDARKGG